MVLNITEEGPEIGTSLIWVLTCCSYFVGISLHSKVLFVSLREKDLTWKFNVTNAIVAMFHFSHVLFLHILTYFVEDLSTYTGDWFCYVAKVLRYYGAMYITGYSLMISSLKYILIIYWKDVREFGKNKTKEIVFWFHLLHPSLNLLLHLIVTPDFIWTYDAYKEIDLCLGDPKNHWTSDNTTSQIKLHDLCLNLLKGDRDGFVDHFIVFLQSCMCWFQFVILYLTTWNLLELILYCRIFWFMRR